MKNTIYDVIVVGSGPGGSSAAALVAEAGLNVLLLEEGRSISQSEVKPFSLKEMDSKYRNQGVTVAFGNPKINYVEGSCVGGGSEVNSGLYYPPSKAIIDKWKSDYAVQDLSYEELVQYSEIVKKDINVSYMPGTPPLASRKLQIGSKVLGWSSLEVPRWFKYDDLGINSTQTGVRQGMSETYIPRFLQANGNLISNFKVERFNKAKGTWCVEGIDKQSSRKIEFNSTYLFIACGSVQTPALLRQNGIVKNIGNSLKMHPTVKVIAKFPEIVNEENLGVPVHQVKEFAPKYSFGCAISSKEYLAAGLIDYPQTLSQINDDWKHLASYYAMSSGGKGLIRNIPALNTSVVNYSLDDNDMLILGEAIKKLCLLLFKAGATELYPSISGLTPLQNIGDIDKIPNVLDKNSTSIMTIHLMASCPMGEDKSKCAVDSYGQVHGADGLYITDTSILCTSLGFNPQGTTLAIIRRNVLKFLESLSEK